WVRARGILMQIAKGLRAAHAQGIIHRDMKPENIFLVQREGRPDFVKVLDFGIAKVVSADNNDGPRLTQTGMIFGTPEYMSPEQAQGQPPDHRVDVYAVGCIMYHMLTGLVPFHADSFMGILTKHLLEPVIPPRQRRPDLQIPADVEAVCMRALEKDRDRRWADMDAFYRAIGAAGGLPFEPSTVTRIPTPALPGATLKYPSLAETNADVRESKTAITATPPVGAFDDERPSRPEPPGGGLSARAKLALGAAAVVAIVSIMVLALRGGSPSPGGTVADKPAVMPPVEKAALIPPAPPPENPAAVPAAVNPPAAAPAAAAEPASTDKPARARRHHGESDKVDPLHRKIDVPGDPTTPAELKNPFAAP
ncbi:MAG: serine/threonine-protein kinase, partial [Verrucomicrobiota bacterium]